MYTQQEASAMRQRFWTSFGRYMSPVPSSIGSKVNWINYRTGIKFISFKMETSRNAASIAIEISQQDQAIRQLYFDRFKALKNELEKITGEKWEWEPDSVNVGGTLVARIYATLKNANVYIENNWPEIISFLKDRIIALDRFWNEYKEVFDT